MNSRFQQLIESEGLTPARFADAIGVQRSNVSHILSGRNKPGFDFIEKLMRRFPEVNIEWLILGKGSMYKEAQMPSLFPDEEVNVVPTSPVKEQENDRQAAAASKPFAESRTNESGEAAATGSSSEVPVKQLVRVLFFYSNGTFEVFNK